MWMMMKTTTTFLLLLVVTLVAGQKSLVDFTKEELQQNINDDTFMPELVSCVRCEIADCRPLSLAIMRDMHLVVEGCLTCSDQQKQLVNNFLPVVESKYPNEYDFLRTTLTSSVSC
ncbi:uncharacterized protein [Panulirus ornatus]|uniref:uncharacterized protein n=1 Tax=Panulirus ornatus TaxID=150431 RepID=UPI003A873AA1